MKPHIIHSTIAALTMFSVLPFATAAPEKGSAPTFDPAGTDPIKPLWVLSAQALADPGQAPAPLSKGIGRVVSTKSGHLVFSFGGSKEIPDRRVVMVAGSTGKVLWRTVLTDRPGGHQ